MFGYTEEIEKYKAKIETMEQTNIELASRILQLEEQAIGFMTLFSNLKDILEIDEKRLKRLEKLENNLLLIKDILIKDGKFIAEADLPKVE